jgi:acetate kinase
MAAAMDGLDCLAFTGGVGENAAEVRGAVIDGLSFLGLAADPERNRRARGDATVGSSRAATSTYVIAAREDVEIARQVRQVLRAST